MSGEILRELQSLIKLVKTYENPSYQEAARSALPLEDFEAIVQAKIDSLEECGVAKSTANVPTTVDRSQLLREMMLLDIMDWFKNSFFSWVDTLPCPQCGGNTEAIGHCTPTPQELAQSASRVEGFTCRQCSPNGGVVARFPRINNPVVLLQTRRGRCGEWANCFGLICRALGWEVRHVRDWSDHVWIEIFINDRWVHVDPCENSFDSPFLYERGWGKKLSYVIAVSKDDIQDVTWRYIQDKSLQDVLSRRNLISESDLLRNIMMLREELQLTVSKERKAELDLRLVKELADFLFPRKQEFKDSEQIGRVSGSLAWRLARQELGNNVASSTGQKYIWHISKATENNDVKNSYEFKLHYDCAKDVYEFFNDGNSLIKRAGWLSGTFYASNVFRKVETDWKMAYLARKENTIPLGNVSWKFAIPPNFCHYYITSLEISVPVTTFSPRASIKLYLSVENETTNKLVDSVQDYEGDRTLKYYSTVDFPSCREILLQISVEGGDGSNSWQHAQIFRQSLNSVLPTDCLSVKIVTKKLTQTD